MTFSGRPVPAEGDARLGTVGVLIVDEQLPATATVAVIARAELRRHRPQPVLSVVLRESVGGTAASGQEQRSGSGDERRVRRPAM